MSKRGAANYLTDQNWEQEEEEEEAGVFKQADKETLVRRPIKKAVRRKGADESGNSDPGGSSTFKGFTGFSGFQKTSETANVFSSLGSKPLTFSNGAATAPSFKSTPLSNDVNQDKTSSASDTLNPPLTNGNGETKTPISTRSKYLQQLKSLNEGVSKWIKDHVDKNPYCVLTPIFKDYEKYLADLDKKYPPESREPEGTAHCESKDENQVEKTNPTPAKSSPIKSSVFGAKASSSPSATCSDSATSNETLTSGTNIAATSAAPAFSFGAKDLSSSSGSLDSTRPSESQSGGIFGSSSSSSSSFSGFKFGASQGSVFGGATGTSGFSFGAPAKSSGEEKPGTSNAAKPEDEDYVPPKLEVTEVQEDDAFYSKRCKLFFKKDEQWKEKGVGNLHLKPCGEKTQLLVRADTNLGNILLNIMLSSSLPLTRQGKNNVAIVCVPNPPIDGIEEKSMVPMLIRVKTTEDADELLEKLKKKKVPTATLR